MSLANREHDPAPVVQPSARQYVGRTVGLYLTVATTLSVVVAAAPAVWPRGDAPARPRMVADWLLGNWLWWDGGWYLSIARNGYGYIPHQQSSVAFFPSYPLAVRLLGALVPGGHAVAALAITAACGLAGLLLFQRWCERRMSAFAAHWAVVVLAVYPYAWFLYGAAYADALLLVATILAFLLIEADRPLAAGLVGIIATAARPTGIVVLVGLIVLTLDRRGLLGGRGRLHQHDLGIGLSAIGIVGWCIWLAVRFGNPFAFIETEGAKGWDRAPGVATWFKFNFFRMVAQDPPTRWVPLAIQGVLCLAFAAAIPAVWRRFGAGYGIYTATAVLVPAFSTDDFMGTGRYLLAAFPVLAVVGAKLAESPRGRWAFVGASSAGLVLATSLFATGHLMA